MDFGSVYRETRLRMADLVDGLPPSREAAPVPACPEWTVKDLVAHVTGVCADIRAGNLDGVATEPWTAEQVASRRSKRLAEILEEWSRVGPEVEEAARIFPPVAAAQWVSDLASHEHDLRGALESPGARDSSATHIAVDFMAQGFVHSVLGLQLPTLVVRANGHEWRAGEGEAEAKLETEPFELLRSITGRRSAAQIRTLAWNGDAETYLPAFEWGPFSPADRDIIE